MSPTRKRSTSKSDFLPVTPITPPSQPLPKCYSIHTLISLNQKRSKYVPLFPSYRRPPSIFTGRRPGFLLRTNENESHHIPFQVLLPYNSVPGLDSRYLRPRIYLPQRSVHMTTPHISPPVTPQKSRPSTVSSHFIRL